MVQVQSMILTETWLSSSGSSTINNLNRDMAEVQWFKYNQQTILTETWLSSSGSSTINDLNRDMAEFQWFKYNQQS